MSQGGLRCSNPALRDCRSVRLDVLSSRRWRRGHNHFIGLLTLVTPLIGSAQTIVDSRARKNHCRGRRLEHLVVERVAPTWPPERGMRVKGDVIVKITIDEKGKLVSARAICGHQLKADFAIMAVSKWKFRPEMVNGKARKVTGIVVVVFPAPAPSA
jgi:TonB family protein